MQTGTAVNTVDRASNHLVLQGLFGLSVRDTEAVFRLAPEPFRDREDPAQRKQARHGESVSTTLARVDRGMRLRSGSMRPMIEGSQ